MRIEKATHSICLNVFEAVISGGVRKVTWRVHCSEKDDWISAFDCPGAESEYLDGQSGVVWQKRVQLPLTQGSRLLRVESRPVPRESRDPMSFLEGTRNNSKERTLRTEFHIGTSGRLVRTKRNTLP